MHQIVKLLGIGITSKNNYKVQVCVTFKKVNQDISLSLGYNMIFYQLIIL